jgi:hypothetical protein
MTAIAVRTQARNVRSLAAWSLYRSIMGAFLPGAAAWCVQIHRRGSLVAAARGARKTKNRSITIRLATPNTALSH